MLFILNAYKHEIEHAKCINNEIESGAIGHVMLWLQLIYALWAVANATANLVVRFGITCNVMNAQVH